VRDQIHPHASGRRLIPVGKGSHRDPTADFRRHSAELLRARRVARCAEQSVDRDGPVRLALRNSTDGLGFLQMNWQPAVRHLPPVARKLSFPIRLEVGIDIRFEIVAAAGLGAYSAGTLAICEEVSEPRRSAVLTA
jgi:hypothetical protein